MRVVHGVDAESDEWDASLLDVENGWPGYFRVLRLYLAHFPGQPGSSVHLMSGGPGSVAGIWDSLMEGLGLAGAAEGETRRTTGSGGASIAGLVERADGGDGYRDLLMRCDEPGPGVASLCAYAMGDMVRVSFSLFFYGEGAAAVAERVESGWRAWMDGLFPPAPP
ncbi:MAG: hypothetical protein ACYTGZ_12545 [Planctomycetota bacterium]